MEPVGEQFDFVRVPLTGHLFVYPAGTCQAGAPWIESDGPFWGTVWGWGSGDTQRLLDWSTSGTYALPLVGVDELSPAPPRK